MRISCRSWRNWPTSCRRCRNACCCTIARSSRPRVCRSSANTRKCWRRIRPSSSFADFDENTRATTFHTTGTTGRPKGVYFSHRQLVLHTLAIATEYGPAPSQGRIHRDDVYMPLTPMFHVHAWGSPYLYTMMGNKQVYPGRYAPDVLLGLIAREGVTSTHCVPTILQMLLSAPGSKDVDPLETEDGGRRLRNAAVAGQGRTRAGHRRLHRLRAIRILPNVERGASGREATVGRSRGPR